MYSEDYSFLVYDSFERTMKGKIRYVCLFFCFPSIIKDAGMLGVSTSIHWRKPNVLGVQFIDLICE